MTGMHNPLTPELTQVQMHRHYLELIAAAGYAAGMLRAMADGRYATDEDRRRFARLAQVLAEACSLDSNNPFDWPDEPVSPAEGH